MNEDLGWALSTIVVGSSLTSITSAVMGPLLGGVVDARGPRVVLVPSILLMGFSLLCAGQVTEPWQFYLTFGLMSGAARSALQSVVPGAMIASWFFRRRAAAYGFAAMGPPISNLTVPPLMAVLVGALGWRTGWTALAAVGLGVGLLPALLLRRRGPQELGLQLDGDPPSSDESVRAIEASTSSSAAETSVRAATPGVGYTDWTAREAIHSSAFWLVAAAMSLILIAPNVSIVFMFSYLNSKGISGPAAAAALSIVPAMQVLSRMFFWAPMIGRVGSVRWMLVLWGSILLCSSLLLAFAQGEIWAYFAAVILGFGLGGNLVLQLQVWPEYFGRKAIGTIIGTGHLVQGISSATAPLLLAALVDRTGNYTQLYLIVAGLVLAGLVIHLVVGVPRHPAPASL